MTILATLVDGLAIERLAIAELREQDVNAHVMPQRVFDRLVDNIKKRGELESLPLCAESNGRIEIVSGHHRVRAARAAGLTEVPVLVDRSGLSRSAIVAKQIAHNALIGRDEEELVKRLIADIETPDDLLETGLDETFLAAVDGNEALESLLPMPDIQWKTVTFTFLPHQLVEFDALVKEIGDADLVGVVPEDQFDPFMDAVAKYGRATDVRGVGSIVAMLTRLAREQFVVATATD